MITVDQMIQIQVKVKQEYSPDRKTNVNTAQGGDNDGVNEMDISNVIKFQNDVRIETEKEIIIVNHQQVMDGY